MGFVTNRGAFVQTLPSNPIEFFQSSPFPSDRALVTHEVITSKCTFRRHFISLTVAWAETLRLFFLIVAYSGLRNGK